jgi:hypothetical protein
MVWWHSRGSDDWLSFANDWLTRCPDWQRKQLDANKRRLMLQTRLTHPSTGFPRMSVVELDQKPPEFVQSKLWAFLLNRESKALDMELETWIGRGLARDTDARVIFDVHHWKHLSYPGW